MFLRYYQERKCLDGGVGRVARHITSHHVHIRFLLRGSFFSFLVSTIQKIISMYGHSVGVSFRNARDPEGGRSGAQISGQITKCQLAKLRFGRRESAQNVYQIYLSPKLDS